MWMGQDLWTIDPPLVIVPLGRNLVTWRNEKQTVMARSSAEPAYRSMAHGACELIWLKMLMKDLGLL